MSGTRYILSGVLITPMSQKPEFPTPQMLQCRNEAPELLLRFYDAIKQSNLLDMRSIAGVTDWADRYRRERDRVKAAIRERGLAKLTALEIEALGVR